MKFLLVAASFIACTLAQRLSIVTPATGAVVSSKGDLAVDLHEAVCSKLLFIEDDPKY